MTERMGKYRATLLNTARFLEVDEEYRVMETTINVWKYALKCNGNVVEVIYRAAAHAMNIPVHAGTKLRPFPVS